MATKLEKLSIEELSGVENPANETPGWLVMKSETQEALLKEVDRMESDFAILYAALKSTEDYLGDAPEDVVKAESLLVSYVESLFEGSADDENSEPTPDNETTEAPVAEKSATPKSTRTLMKTIFGGRDDEDLEKTEDEEVEVEDVLEDEVDEDVEVDDVSDEDLDEAEAEAEDEEVEKSAEDDLIAVLTRIAKSQDDTAADVAAFRDVLGNVVERIERLEVRKTGLDPDLEDAVAKEKISPLRSAVASAMNGNRVTIS